MNILYSQLNIGGISMKNIKNIGRTDRVIRFILGIGLIAAGVILQLTIGRLWWLALISVVPFLTASIRTCPLYLPFRINTNRS